MPLFGLKTVHQGEQVLVRNHRGEARVVEGPSRLTLWRSRVERMESRFASEGEYLQVNQRAGPRLCIPGPAQLFLNPLEHESIYVKEGLLISANEALVVYTQPHQGNNNHIYSKPGEEQEHQDGTYKRKILYGPLRYIPKPNEWIHEFSWHGEDPDNKTRKVKGALQFTKLRVVADQFYFNVSDVRTRDDTQVTVKLMIFFELVDIEKMLDSTHDPIADFINAVASDTVQYVSGLSYEEFVANTVKMNEMETFAQLAARAENIGYRINKVVFRGFHSSNALQEMHDKAIHERTRLRLEAETESHRQNTLDLQLEKTEERGAREREIEKEREEHRRSMEREKHNEKLRLEALSAAHRAQEKELEITREAERWEKIKELQEKQVEHQIKIDKMKNEENLKQEVEAGNVKVELEKRSAEVIREKTNVELERLKAMNQLGVDLSKVLVAECRNPDKLIQVETKGKGEGNFHIHENQ